MNNKIIKLFKAFGKKFSEEKIFKESAALTFVTLVGFVPFIIFIIFFLPQLPFLKLESQLSDILISIFLPSSAEQIKEYISQIANQKISFNLFSFMILLITSYSLFKIINDSFDNILNVHELRKKDFLFNFVKFLGMTIFGSLLLLILLSATSIPIVSKFFKLSVLQGIALYVTPFVLLFIIFSLSFLFIPTIKLKISSIFIGSAISAATWIIFKSLFNWYIFTLTNTKIIFGVLATVPVFLFWIFANWIIILSGLIIVSILENRHIKTEVQKSDLQTVRITFEKIVNNKSLEDISSTTLNKQDMKKILREILKEEEQENQSTEKQE